jgi:hypothetical protein
MARETRTLARYDDDDDRALLDAPPPRPPARRRADPLDVASRTAGLLIKLTLLAILVAVLIGVVGLMGAGGRATAGLGAGLSGAVERGAGAVANAVQAARDAADPAHPPRQSLAYDTELEELTRLDVGSPIPGASERTLVLSGVQRRESPEHPDAAVYAVLHSELKTPRETRILGVVVSSTRDPSDLYLYKGETFRVGRKLYKVNWVSLERNQIAIATYRDPDRVTAPLKFELD